MQIPGLNVNPLHVHVHLPRADDGHLSYVPTGELRAFFNIEDWLKYSLPAGTSNVLFQSVWKTLVLDPACNGTPHWGKAGGHNDSE